MHLFLHVYVTRLALTYCLVTLILNVTSSLSLIQSAVTVAYSVLSYLSL